MKHLISTLVSILALFRPSPASLPSQVLLPTPTPPSITLVSTGDIMLGRTINAQAVKSHDYYYPFASLGPLLSAADITFINLENPIISACPVLTSGFKFCADTSFLPALAWAGIDVVNLANNHATNFGPTGLQETQKLLSTHGFTITGVGEPAILTVSGTRIAFLGFNDVGGPYPNLNQATSESITTQISLASTKADFVVVQFHWGTEYVTNPSVRQKSLAHLAIDSGANIVIGNHSHWVQPVEKYQDGYIVYSHGNFIFDQSWSQATMEGAVSRFTIVDNQVTQLEILPVLIARDGQPKLAPEPIASGILNRMRYLP